MLTVAEIPRAMITERPRSKAEKREIALTRRDYSGGEGQPSPAGHRVR